MDVYFLLPTNKRWTASARPVTHECCFAANFNFGFDCFRGDCNPRNRLVTSRYLGAD